MAAGRIAPAAVAAGLRRRVARRLRAEPAPAGPQLSPSEELLLSSSLFDEEWYALQSGRDRDRLAAVRHYLRRGSDEGLTPHPLVLPALLAAQIGEEQLAGEEPFVVYLRQRMWRKRTHPLFEAGRYVKAHPEALEHPDGPLGHYAAIGAPAGLRTNRVMPADEEGRYPDVRAWVTARGAEWSARTRDVATVWSSVLPSAAVARFAPRAERLRAAGEHAAEVSAEPLVTVVVDAGQSAEHLTSALRSVAAQTLGSWEVVILDRGGVEEVATIAEQVLGTDVTVVTSAYSELPSAVSTALAGARGRYVAFLDPGDTWIPERLAILVGAGDEHSSDLVADIMAATKANGERVFSHGDNGGARVTNRKHVRLGRLLIRRSCLADVGPVDPTVHGAWDFDLVARLCDRAAVEHAMVVGVERDFAARREALKLPPSLRPSVDHLQVAAWADVVLNRRLIDWDALAEQQQEAGTVSVVIPTYDDWEMTQGAVDSVMAAAAEDGIPVDCIVWDNGSAAATSVLLDLLEVRFPAVRTLHSPVNHGFALGNNLAVAHARGEFVVFLNNDTTVAPGWLAPLVGALRQEETLAAQSLLLYPTGSIQSAGVVFPSTGGLPHAFLQGFPVEDAHGIEDLEFAALTGAALAIRFSDVAALQGFDPIFTNGMEDVDLCHRLAARRPGTFRVLGDVPVTHYESRTPGRYARYMENRGLYLDRWAGVLEPRDDAAKWASAGLSVVDHQVSMTADWQYRRFLIPVPVLVRSERLEVRERPQRLRWAIKNPAPWGPEGELWGDTHFARAIGTALRACGQEVVIDHRPEFHRATSRHDDVALVLRGLAPFKPSPEQISLAWVISHPEMLARAEAESYDKVLGASQRWSEQISARWGLDVETLLQATDPELFTPERGTPDTGHPVLFVGSSRKVYRRIVRDSVEAGLPLSVYGANWAPFLDQRFIKAGYLPNDQLGAAYRSAGVVLNDHWEDMRQDGFLSNRLFDAVASGARVVSDEVDGIAGLFGRSVQIYRTPEDLVRLTSLPDPDAVFGDDDERREVASRVRREHSFRARAERLVELAHQLRAERGFTR